jgi:nitroreductase
MDYESLLKFLKRRRTVRDIKPDSIPDDYVEKILEAARWAPSGFNTQPWEFVVIKDPELKKRIKEIVDDYRVTDFFDMEATREEWQGPRWDPEDRNVWRLSAAPVFILVLGDIRTQVGLPMPVRYCQQKRVSIWESSLADAFLYMQLAATSLGLASHWVSAVKIPQLQCAIKNAVGIPPELEIYDMMALGYGGSPPEPKTMRKLKELVHYDYAGPDEFRTDEEVREFIRKTRLATVGRIT